jgi:outer membrane protein OmpU
MKKVLFASTALVATAGVAAADVTFGGYGRFGIIYVEGAGADGVFGTADDVDSTDLTHRLRLQIDATAESDAGVVFGARVRIQQNASSGIAGGLVNPAGGTPSANNGTNGARFFARSGGFEVGVGNIYGALEFMPGMYPIDLGLTGLGYDYTAYNFRGDAYTSNSGGSGPDNGVEVLYSAGDLSIHVSYSQAFGAYTNNSGVAVVDDRDRLAAYAAYTWNGWTFALGAQDSDDSADTEFAASASGSFGPADVTLAYADNGTGGDYWVLATRFDVGAATAIEAYVADHENQPDTGYGIGVHHDLGGGTSIRGGVAKLTTGATRADVGVRFNF